MCDPISIASATLAVGSTVANQMAASEVEQARNDALAAERLRQGKLDQEADAINLQSQDRYRDFEGQQEERTQQLGDFLKSQTAEEPARGIAMPESQSAITVQEEGRQRDVARAFTDQSAENLARLRSFGDLLGGIGRQQSRDAGLVSQLGNFKQGSQGVVPLEMQAAQSAGGGWRLLGDVLGSGAKAGMMAGAAGKGPSWDDLFGSPGQVATGPPRQLWFEPRPQPLPPETPDGVVRLPPLW